MPDNNKKNNHHHEEHLTKPSNEVNRDTMNPSNEQLFSTNLNINNIQGELRDLQNDAKTHASDVRINLVQVVSKTQAIVAQVSTVADDSSITNTTEEMRATSKGFREQAAEAADVATKAAQIKLDEAIARKARVKQIVIISGVVTVAGLAALAGVMVYKDRNKSNNVNKADSSDIAANKTAGVNVTVNWPNNSKTTESSWWWFKK